MESARSVRGMPNPRTFPLQKMPGLASGQRNEGRRVMGGTSKPHKYRAKKTKVDGIPFASKKEARRYMELKLLERGGGIQGLELQPSFTFTIKGETLCYSQPEKDARSNRPIIYKADFRYRENGKTIVEDVKGFRTPAYKLKKALMKYCNGIEVRET